MGFIRFVWSSSSGETGEPMAHRVFFRSAAPLSYVPGAFAALNPDMRKTERPPVAAGADFSRETEPERPRRVKTVFAWN